MLSRSFHLLAGGKRKKPTSKNDPAFVYVATHPWIQHYYGPNAVHKIGFTSSVATRFGSHSAYTTCFTPGWKLVNCYRLKSRERAAWLEKGCLDVLDKHRLDGKELVRLPHAEIDRVVCAVGGKLNLKQEQLDEAELEEERRKVQELVTGNRSCGDSNDVTAGDTLSVKQMRSPKGKAMLKAIDQLCPSLRSALPPPATLPTHFQEHFSTGSTAGAADEDALVDTVLDGMVRHLHQHEKIENGVGTEAEKEEKELEHDAEAIVMTSHMPTSDKRRTEQYLRRDALVFRPVHLRPHQRDAVSSVLEQFSRASFSSSSSSATVCGNCGVRSTIVQMACRCGKTPVAHALICLFAEAQKELAQPQQPQQPQQEQQQQLDNAQPEPTQNEDDPKLQQKLWIQKAAELLKQQQQQQYSASSSSSRSETETTTTTTLCVVYLAPSLSLVRQTAQKLVGYGGVDPTGVLLVGSDNESVYVHPPPQEASSEGDVHRLSFTTDREEVQDFLSSARAQLKVVVSTYQSSALVDIHHASFRNVVMMVFDECHRVCGGSVSARDISSSPFAYHALYATPHRHNKNKEERAEGEVDLHVPFRLFMTATPIYDNPINMLLARRSIPKNAVALRRRSEQLLLCAGERAQEDDGSAESLPEPINPLSMRQREVFGGVAHRYNLRQGIREGFANDFAVKITLAAVDEAIPKPRRRGKPGRPSKKKMATAMASDEGVDKKTTERETEAFGAPLFVTANQLEAALAHADKILVFCRSIRHVDALYEFLSNRQKREVPLESTETSKNNKRKKKKPTRAQDASLLRDVELLRAHSKDPASVIPALTKFSLNDHNANTAKGTKRKSILLNCRLFQEGIEVPHLNGVFFASPRGSAKDIVQCVCRPLNKLPGKPPSVIFLPIPYYSKFPISHQCNVDKMSKVVAFVDALKDEDPTMYEYFMDPANRHYDLSVIRGAPNVGGNGAYDDDEREFEAAVLPQFIKTVRFRGSRDFYRRPSEIPWELGFGALKRVVTQCGRYPKTNEAWTVGKTHIGLHAFYDHCRKAYLQCHYVAHVHDQLQGDRKKMPSSSSPLNELDPLKPENIEAALTSSATKVKEARKRRGRKPKKREENEEGEDMSTGLLQSQKLFEPYQLRDLESLPHWQRYGIGGPYPAQECIATLRRLLEKPQEVVPQMPAQEQQGGTSGRKKRRSAPVVRFPPLPIHRGGYVGLDATPMERLTGFLCTVNQQDAIHGARFSARVTRAMEAVCKPHRLKWRKDRFANGRLRTKQSFTFIQQSYEDFKQEETRVPQAPWFKKYLAEHFPDYPHKHFAQERLDVLANGVSPPKIRRLSDFALKRRLTRELSQAAEAKQSQRKRKTGKRRRGVTEAQLTQKKHHLAAIEARSLKGHVEANAHFGAEIEESRQVYKCRVCKMLVDRDEWSKHLKTKGHLMKLEELKKRS